MHVNGDSFEFALRGLPTELNVEGTYAVFPRNKQWLQHAPIRAQLDADHTLHFSARRSDYYTGWPDHPTLLLRADAPPYATLELRLDLGPPALLGDTP